MLHLFSAPGIQRLETWTSGNVLLAFDFDGTLAPITPDPDEATMCRETRTLLRKVALRYPCIVVSGRRRTDVRRRLRGIRLQEVVGNHGIEPWSSSSALAAMVRSWMPSLRQGLRSLPGVVLEGKRFSISVHYRKAPDPRQAVRAIHRTVEALRGARLVGGKKVVNIVPEGAPDKGKAVEAARRRGDHDRVIYVGDDETDESAFAMERAGRLLGIRVGMRRSSRACFYIRRQPEIDRLLALLVALRAQRSGGREKG